MITILSTRRSRTPPPPFASCAKMGTVPIYRTSLRRGFASLLLVAGHRAFDCAEMGAEMGTVPIYRTSFLCEQARMRGAAGQLRERAGTFVAQLAAVALGAT